MDLKIDPSSMEAMVSRAIFEGMTQEHRDELIKQALASVLGRSERNGYGTMLPSPLQSAFNSAAESVLHKIAHQKFSEDEEFKNQLEGLFKDVAKRLFAEDIRTKLIEQISNQVIKGLSPRDY